MIIGVKFRLNFLRRILTLLLDLLKLYFRSYTSLILIRKNKSTLILIIYVCSIFESFITILHGKV